MKLNYAPCTTSDIFTCVCFFQWPRPHSTRRIFLFLAGSALRRPVIYYDFLCALFLIYLLTVAFHRPVFPEYLNRRHTVTPLFHFPLLLPLSARPCFSFVSLLFSPWGLCSTKFSKKAFLRKRREKLLEAKNAVFIKAVWNFLRKKKKILYQF